MIINKVICDRCGCEIEGGAHPPRIVKQTYKSSTRATDPSGYRNADKIHLCEDCAKHFEEFMNNER